MLVKTSLVFNMFSNRMPSGAIKSIVLALVKVGLPTPVFCIAAAFILDAVNIPVAVISSNVTSFVVFKF